MKSYVSKGTICVKDAYGLTYAVCGFEYILNEDESYGYYFRPNYSVISLLDSSIFQGIPGLNLDLHREIYERKNMTPCFVSERVPSPRREDYFELLEEAGLEYMDPVLYLQKTPKQYSGDNLFVIPFVEKRLVVIDLETQKNNLSIIKEILENICIGNDVRIGPQIIEDTNRAQMFFVLSTLYHRSVASNRILQEEGIRKAKDKGMYVGRKPVPVDHIRFLEVQEKVEKNRYAPDRQQRYSVSA